METTSAPASCANYPPSQAYGLRNESKKLTNVGSNTQLSNPRQKCVLCYKRRKTLFSALCSQRPGAHVLRGKLSLSLSRCCTLWVPIDWPLAPRPFIDPRSWLTFICKAALVPLRYYPGDFVEMAACDQEAASLSVPRRPKSGRRAFVSSVTSAGNRREMSLKELVCELKRFKEVLRRPDLNIPR